MVVSIRETDNLLGVTKANSTEKIAQLEQEVHALKKEIERPRRLLEEALRGPGSDKRHPFRDRNPKLNRKGPDAKQESSMGADLVGPSPKKSMKL
ncbi:MAG: hypothetical protein ABSA57_20270 [Candidatus Acidiferrales bacterium]